MDIVDLYPSLPTNLEVLDLVRHFLDFVGADDSMELMQIIFFIAEQLVCVFWGFFQQLSGVPMGASYLPPLANLLVFYLIEMHFSDWLMRDWTCYFRFLDDLLLISYGPHSRVDEILLFLNNVCPALQFTCETVALNCPDNFVAVLDLEMYLGADYQVHFRCHQKPLARFQYVCFASMHPVAVKRSIVKTKLLRYVRNSSTPKAFEMLR